MNDEILICPNCKRKVSWRSARSSEWEFVGGVLWCPNCTPNEAFAASVEQAVKRIEMSKCSRCGRSPDSAEAAAGQFDRWVVLNDGMVICDGPDCSVIGELIDQDIRAIEGLKHYTQGGSSRGMGSPGAASTVTLMTLSHFYGGGNRPLYDRVTSRLRDRGEFDEVQIHAYGIQSLGRQLLTGIWLASE